jgi:IS1 family transposase
MFKKMGMGRPHGIEGGESRTRLIESANSGVRGDLARFNRKSKSIASASTCRTTRCNYFFIASILMST